MTSTNHISDIPTTGDKVDLHRDMAMLHAQRAQRALQDLEGGDRRDALLNQHIGVNLKLADVHARLALAISRSGGLG